MFIYKFNDFLLYQLGSLFGYQSYNPGMDFDHDAAHSTNFLRTFIDKQFTHVHVILPGKDSLDLELKNLLMSDKSKYGITEQQIDHCAQQYQCHVEHYSLTEHKQAVHNLSCGGLTAVLTIVYKHIVKAGQGSRKMMFKRQQIGFCLFFSQNYLFGLFVDAMLFFYSPLIGGYNIENKRETKYKRPSYIRQAFICKADFTCRPPKKT